MEQTLEEFATVTSNGSVNIPSKIREQLRIKKGSKIKFILQNGALHIVPVLTFQEMAGIDEDKKEIIYQIIRDISEDRRREARSEKLDS